MPDATGANTKLNQIVEFIAVQNYVGGVSHETHVHAEEVLGEVWVGLVGGEVEEVLEGKLAGASVDLV